MQHGYAGEVFNEEISRLALTNVLINCPACGSQIIYFGETWYDAELDFDNSCYLPMELHTKSCKDVPKFHKEIESAPHVFIDKKPLFLTYWDMFPDSVSRQKAQRAIFFTKGSGSKVCDWIEIDSSGDSSTEIEIPKSLAMGLFQATYSWYEKGDGTFELAFCDTADRGPDCISKGFHGEFDLREPHHPCPFSKKHWDKLIKKKCDCYLTKVSGHCIEEIIAIDKVHNLEKPMENLKFMGWIVGMLSFLQRYI